MAAPSGSAPAVQQSMPLMASFVHKTTGATTADAGEHRYLWIRFDNDAFASKLKTFQSWIGMDTVGTKLVFSWTDIVALWSEVGRIGDDIVAYAIVGWLISPSALARGLEVVLADMPTTAHTRPQGIRFIQHKCRDLPKGELSKLTLTSADLISRSNNYLPEWQTITYGHAHQLGVEPIIGWLHYYDPKFMRGEDYASSLLWEVRKYLVTVQHLIEENTAPERPPPARVPDAVYAQQGDAQPSNEDAIAAAMDEWNDHAHRPQPDNVDPATVRYNVANAIGSNQYHSDIKLRVELEEGPARRTAAIFEIYALDTGIDGTASGMRSRYHGVVSAIAKHGDVSPLEELFGDAHLSFPAFLVAVKELGQLLLSEERQKDAFLYTPQGARALNNALKPYAAFLDHVRGESSGGAAGKPPVAGLLERLSDHIADNAATRGVSAISAGDGAATSTSMGGASAAGKHVNTWLKAAAMAENAQVIFWVVAMLKKGATSIEVHQAVFVASNEEHPKWKSTGFLHAMGWGFINASLVNADLAPVYEYSSDHYLGKYLAHMIVAAMKRSNLLSDNQVSYLKGYSLERLASKLRSGDWSKLDLVNDVDLAIQGRLAELTYGTPPAAVPYEVILTNTTSVARAITITKAIFEALGMQRDGPCSLASLMTTRNNEAQASTSVPTEVLAKCMKSNSELYKLGYTLAGNDYHATRGAISVHRPLPDTNYKAEDLEPAEALHDRAMALLVRITEEAQARSFLGDLAVSKETRLLGVTAADAASALIMQQHVAAGASTQKTKEKKEKDAGGVAPGAAGGATPGTKRQKEELDVEQEAKRRKELDDQSRAKAKALEEEFDKADKVEILGRPSEKQTMWVGPRGYDFSALKEAHGTDVCWPAIVGRACGSTKEKRDEYERKLCPHSEEEHPNGCQAHILPEGCGMAKFRIDNKTEKGAGGKGKGGGKGKSKGRGGKGKGKGGAKRK